LTLKHAYCYIFIAEAASKGTGFSRIKEPPPDVVLDWKSVGQQMDMCNNAMIMH